MLMITWTSLNKMLGKRLVIAFLCISPVFKLAPVFSEEVLIQEPEKSQQETEDIAQPPGKPKTIQEEIQWLQAEAMVTIATRHETPIDKAPSIITVITAEEIKNLGYRTFSELLRTVPGFEVIKEADSGDVASTVRGLDGGNKLRVMINGHLVNNPLHGDAFDNFDDFPVRNIKRLEIIRGPGSAMYGENAFLGVINIVTFEADDIDGARVSSGYGSFDTYEEDAIFGKRYGDVAISGMVHHRQTGGFDGTIKSDSQTILDNQLGTSASQSPGSMHDGRQEYDMHLKVDYRDLYFQGWYSNKNQGPGVGPQFALNDGTNVEENYVFGEVGYKKTFEERFTLKPRVYFDQFDHSSFIDSLPPGTTSDTDGDGIADNIYPYGFMSQGRVIEKVVGTEIPFDYALFDGNILTLGLEYRLTNQTGVQFSSNFDPGTLEALSSMQDFSDTYPFLKETTRRVESFYLQDVWDITKTVNLTLGVRHDQYSDFGGATSPRAGLTWAFMKNASLKLLYGKAFRAPSFEEMFAENLSNFQGNENLTPEKIRTYELGLSYRFNKHVTSSVNLFDNKCEDIISLLAAESNNSTMEVNAGRAHIRGIEAETKVDITKGNYIFMNYTCQSTQDNDGDAPLPYIANHKGNLGVNWRSWEYINTNLSAFVSGRRTREEYDSRNELPAYMLLNLSVIGKEFFKTMEVQGTVFNILDKDYSDPGTASIPNDIPRPGRTFFVGLSYAF